MVESQFHAKPILNGAGISTPGVFHVKPTRHVVILAEVRAHKRMSATIDPQMRFTWNRLSLAELAMVLTSVSRENALRGLLPQNSVL